MRPSGAKPPTPPSALGLLKPSVTITEEQEQAESAQNVSTSSHDQQCSVIPVSAWTPSDSNAPDTNVDDNILKPNHTPLSASTRYKQSHPTLFSSPPLAPMSSLCNDLGDLDDLDDGGWVGGG